MWYSNDFECPCAAGSLPQLSRPARGPLMAAKPRLMALVRAKSTATPKAAARLQVSLTTPAEAVPTATPINAAVLGQPNTSGLALRADSVDAAWCRTDIAGANPNPAKNSAAQNHQIDTAAIAAVPITITHISPVRLQRLVFRCPRLRPPTSDPTPDTSSATPASQL